jgi:hypothetical protein
MTSSLNADACAFLSWQLEEFKQWRKSIKRQDKERLDKERLEAKSQT